MHPPVNDTLALEGHSGVHPVLLNHTDITDKSANRSLQQRGDVKIFRANRLNSSDTSVSPQGHLTSNGTKPNTSTGIKFHNDTESDKKFVKLRITTTNDHNNRSEFWLNDNFTLFGFDQNDTTAFLLNRTQGDMSQPQVSENSGVQHWAVHLAIGVAAGTTCLVLFLGKSY